MKPIFSRTSSPTLRLLLSLVLSFNLILADRYLEPFSSVRYLSNTLVFPIQYVADFPRIMFDDLYTRLQSNNFLRTENTKLKHEVFTLKSDLVLLRQYEKENEHLHKLLNSSLLSRKEKKMVVEVMSVESSSYIRQVLIDKGYIDGVYEGQPVVNEKGVVGQVTFVTALSSRVLLLIDSNGAIPALNLRNDIRVIASGNGQIDQMRLDHIPNSTDVRVGDLLVSSGLGGVFPEGYPVGRISQVSRDTQRKFLSIYVAPAVKFDQLRYLLLVWPDDRTKKMLLSKKQPRDGRKWQLLTGKSGNR